MSGTFFERYSELCKSYGQTPNSVAKVVGASSGSVTAWKNGTEPRNSTIVKIASYFGVSVEYLLGKEEAPAEVDRRAASDEDIKFALFGDSEIDDELYEEVKAFAKFAKERKDRRTQ